MRTERTLEETTNTAGVPAYALGPFGASEEYLVFNLALNAEVKATMTPSAYTAPDKAIGISPPAFAPNPTYTPGSCSTGQHWQPDPYNPAAGWCQPNAAPPPPQPRP